jgi:hypothetical protein
LVAIEQNPMRFKQAVPAVGQGLASPSGSHDHGRPVLGGLPVKLMDSFVAPPFRLVESSAVLLIVLEIGEFPAVFLDLPSVSSGALHTGAQSRFGLAVAPARSSM